MGICGRTLVAVIIWTPGTEYTLQRKRTQTVLLSRIHSVLQSVMTQRKRHQLSSGQMARIELRKEGKCECSATKTEPLWFMTKPEQRSKAVLTLVLRPLAERNFMTRPTSLPASHQCPNRECTGAQPPMETLSVGATATLQQKVQMMDL